MQSDLSVEVDRSPEHVLVTTRLTGQEYGAGPSLEEAVMDLVTSLSDYYQSLEARKDRLAPDGEKDLALLSDLIECKAAG